MADQEKRYALLAQIGGPRWVVYDTHTGRSWAHETRAEAEVTLRRLAAARSLFDRVFPQTDDDGPDAL